MIPQKLRLLFLPFALMSLTACNGLGIKVDGGYAQMEFSGDMKLAPSVTVPGLTLDPVDVQDNLGLDAKVGTPYGRVEMGFVLGSITASGFTHSQEGSGVLNARFGDLTASTPVTTSLDLRNAKAALHFDLLNLGVVRVSPGIGIDVFDINLDVKSTALTETVDVIAPVPMVFVQGEVDFGAVEAVVDVGALKADVGDASGTFFDVEALLRYSPTPKIHVFLGARLIRIDADGTADGQAFDLNLTLKGFMGGIGFDI
ncbi:MAG TPA: hypothetical protein ENK02_15435 [Planctomycetes bacterium]|nr:hypothetical protein [Planctomycetota bacterium]